MKCRRKRGARLDRDGAERWVHEAKRCGTRLNEAVHSGVGFTPLPLISDSGAVKCRFDRNPADDDFEMKYGNKPCVTTPEDARPKLRAHLHRVGLVGMR